MKLYRCTKITNKVYFIDYEPDEKPATSNSDQHPKQWIKLVKKGLGKLSIQLPEHGLGDASAFIVEKAVQEAKNLAKKYIEQGTKPSYFLDKFIE